MAGAKTELTGFSGRPTLHIFYGKLSKEKTLGLDKL